MEHALQIKGEELDTNTRRNILLQDVVQKLQVSNRNLLDKIHALKHEREGKRERDLFIYLYIYIYIYIFLLLLPCSSIFNYI